MTEGKNLVLSADEEGFDIVRNAILNQYKSQLEEKIRGLDFNDMKEDVHLFDELDNEFIKQFLIKKLLEE